jgi:hypothetical protein
MEINGQWHMWRVISLHAVPRSIPSSVYFSTFFYTNSTGEHGKQHFELGIGTVTYETDFN